MTLVSGQAIVPVTIIGTAVVCGIISLWRRTRYVDYGHLKDSKIKINKKDYQKDVVYVYGFGKITGIHASPFTHKLLTYLKLSGIPHEIVKGDHMAKNPRAKLPFIEINGQVITDSGRIISYLAKNFKNIDSDLTPQEAAASLSIIRLLEEHYYWTMVYYRWKSPVGYAAFMKRIPIPSILKMLIGPSFKASVVNQLIGHGMGRYSDEDVLEFAREDLQACETLLGDKEFFFGKSTPHLVDVVLYSALACQDFADPTPNFAVISYFPRLLAHKKRMEAILPLNDIKQ